MPISIRSILAGAIVCLMLSACGSSSRGYMAGSLAGGSGTGSGTGGTGGGSGGTGGYGSSGGGINGVHNSVVATPPTGLVSVLVGAQLVVSITFTSSDGNPVSGLSLSNGAGFTLPAGWTGPSTFGCATVSTGSGCVLNLTYQPTVFTGIAKTLTLNYIFIDNSGLPITTDAMGNPLAVSFDYQATTNDNVAPTLAPLGQINATVNSGSQTLTATFATDDGAPASNLAITSDLAALPAGWSAPAMSACATVSAGTPCALTFTYAPNAPDSGTISLSYSFNDDSGTAKTASFNIPYAATANDNVTGAVAPMSPISVAGGGAPQTVTVTFTTDDGFQAMNLSADLTALPPNWSTGTPTFTCASISTGSDCRLSLTYAPPAAGDSGNISVAYNYTDNAGTAKNGTVPIAYASN